MSNPTIINGDLADNDVLGDFSVNKADNSLHLFVVDSLLGAPTIFDGLFISGGDAVDNGDLDVFFRAGAAIYALSTIEVRNCWIENNFARNGGAVYVNRPESVGCIFEDNTFAYNRATSQGAGILIQNTDDVLVQRCTFEDNQTARGAIYPLRNGEVNILDCTFTNNSNDNGFGGAMFIWNNQEVNVRNCDFEGNSAAGSAGVVYIDGRELTDEIVVFDSCTFTENVASGWVGALYFWRSNFEVSNSEFLSNSSGENAGAFYSDGENDYDGEITNCNFLSNSTNGWGGAMAILSSNSTNLSNCVFNGNQGGLGGSGGGGALWTGFTASSSFTDCIFEENSCAWGGAIFSQNDSTAMAFDNCEFLSNSSDGNGGAIYAIAGVDLDVTDCYFELNTAETGGVLSILEDSLDLATVDVSNTIMNFNTAENQGGAMNFSDVDATLTNCLVINSIASGNGTGASISNNASAAKSSVVTLMNTTFGNNVGDGDIGGGVTQWEADMDSEAQVFAQNCIFQEILDNYVIEDGNPEFFSNGGNLLVFRGGDDNTGSNLTNLMFLKKDGRMCIGTSSSPSSLGGGNVDLTDYRLYVKGGIITEQSRVRTDWADYVFADNYDLMPLEEVERFIQENKHLPGATPGVEVEEGGLELGANAKHQQEKIEELFLHLIEMRKEIDALKKENEALKAKLK